MRLMEREKAIKLRQQGYSLKEIAEALSIAKSTASVWLRSVELNPKATERLTKRIKMGVIISAQRKIAKTNEERRLFLRRGLKHLKWSLPTRLEKAKIYLALIYWCEGGKSEDNLLKFSNSDPSLIRFFMTMLRKGFAINEQKFRAVIHIHDYHNEAKQKYFWSKVTNIPPSQFYRSYRKPHTGRRNRLGYPGCITINYYDKLIAREVFGLTQALSILYRPRGIVSKAEHFSPKEEV